MQRVLIISPYFPPSNAADMQRIRMSLPYFEAFGWEPVVVCVNQRHSEMVKDPLLMESLPGTVKIHYVEAFSRKWTGKFGLGSLALRAMYDYNKMVTRLLKEEKFDLIYFSTTQFPITILGSRWKKNFGIPYVIDMQDPWHSDYYQDKPAAERPKKYWFSYRMNKFLEPIAMRTVDGLISVSLTYLETLRERYRELKNVPTAVITFGAFKKDIEIAAAHTKTLTVHLKAEKGVINLVYVGRGGYDMQPAAALLFSTFKQLLQEDPSYSKFRFYFIGTSYAPKGTGVPTILPMAIKAGVEAYVTEETDRISFYESLATLHQANALIVPGTEDAAYTASKIYPYILTEKPLLAILHKESSATKILEACRAGTVAYLNEQHQAVPAISTFLAQINAGNLKTETNWDAFNEYTAKEMTKKQTQLFNLVTGKATADA